MRTILTLHGVLGFANDGFASFHVFTFFKALVGGTAQDENDSYDQEIRDVNSDFSRSRVLRVLTIIWGYVFICHGTPKSRTVAQGGGWSGVYRYPTWRFTDVVDYIHDNKTSMCNTT